MRRLALALVAFGALSARADEDLPTRLVIPKHTPRARFDELKHVLDFDPWEPSKHDVPVELDGSPLPVLDEAELGAYEKSIARSFYADQIGPSTMQLGADLGTLPKLAFGSLDVQWTRLLDESGAEVIHDKIEDGYSPLSSGDEGFYWAQFFSSSPFVRAEGMATLTVSTHATMIELRCDEAGKPSEREGQRATLRRCDNDFFELDWSPPPDGALPPYFVQSFDAAHHRLRTREHLGYLFDGNRTMHDIGYRDLPVTSTARRIRGLAAGRVASVVLSVRAGQSARTFPVVAEIGPRWDSPRKPVRSRVVQDDFAGFGFAIIDDAALRAGIHVTPGIVQGMQQLRVQLPKVDNGAYAKVTFGPATLLDGKAKPIRAQLVVGNVDYPDLVSAPGILGDPTTPFSVRRIARARGTLAVHYPAEVKEYVLDGRAPAQHGLRVELDGARVWLTGEAVALPTGGVSSIRHRMEGVRAFDAQGNQLRQVELKDAPVVNGRRELRFWGLVVQVRVRVCDRWLDVELPYDVGPFPTR